MKYKNICSECIHNNVCQYVVPFSESVGIKYDRKITNCLTFISKSFVSQTKEYYRKDIIKKLRLKELSTPKNKYQLYYSRLYEYFKYLW
jgi:hypothetical protein